MAERVKEKATKMVAVQDIELTAKRMEAEEERVEKISEFMPSYISERENSSAAVPLALTYSPLTKTDEKDRPPPTMHAVEAAAAAELVEKHQAEEKATAAIEAAAAAAAAKVAAEAKAAE